MSLDIHAVAGQGSIRSTHNGSPQRQEAQSQSNEAAAQGIQEKGSELQRQMAAESARQQEIDAARRTQEAEAQRQASRESVEREVQQALKELEDINLSFNHKLKYSINYEEHELLVKVIDPDTDEVIKELPPVAMQKFHARLRDFLGLLVDEEA